MRVRSLDLIVRSLTRPSVSSTPRWQLQPTRSISSNTRKQRVPDFAFAFDIDGVLVRSAKPIPHASTSLQFLQQNDIPFMLLTNGGGRHESERVADLSSKLAVPLHESNFVQSHTPFAELIHGGENSLRDKCILVVGGEYGRCRDVAERYGFTNVVTPGDIYAAHPEIWPFSKPFQRDYYATFARPIPKPINPASLDESLKIDAVFVYNDPRDWGLDMQVILDVMLSHEGYLGTYSRKNGDTSLPNSGYLQDGQPTLYFSNADLLWAADYHLSRLGQGGFQASLEGLWRAVTYHKDHKSTPELYRKVIGKPYRETYEFAEKQLMRHRESMFGKQQSTRLRKVYMVGDNPESDIRGANDYDSPHGIEWLSLLTRTGVYRDQDGRRPTWEPTAIVDDVKAAVQWALKDSAWHEPLR
ncbi:HAD-superfamily subfamily IIA hydrolase [Cladophialophora yegresii CBS 114405]|uniref:HAD-superfamily subfamily IIA hydrolase n=1 Tax=Cladophialophora yegresii CBS 114405 TaxID=1182544 RepID=W9W3E0_9EURO|nr:HAD-superfamily subfamily IIA hydrolase [Cladophialophora yegresii CBS 114405]EXJ62577.1 HAD-superfamily subfamily IIA hydrolase [Cladophialophora yegresii CBS 114405]